MFRSHGSSSLTFFLSSHGRPGSAAANRRTGAASTAFATTAVPMLQLGSVGIRQQVRDLEDAIQVGVLSAREEIRVRDWRSCRRGRKSG